VVQPPHEMVWWVLKVGTMVRRQVMMVVVAEGHSGERKKRKGWFSANFAFDFLLSQVINGASIQQ